MRFSVPRNTAESDAAQQSLTASGDDSNAARGVAEALASTRH